LKLELQAALSFFSPFIPSALCTFGVFGFASFAICPLYLDPNLTVTLMQTSYKTRITCNKLKQIEILLYVQDTFRNGGLWGA
jgi:hypothetical protein